MKHLISLLGVLLLLPLALSAAPATAGEIQAPRDLVSVAVADGRFEVLAAALNPADLITPLRGAGPFPVFAPPDEAFAALPAGTVASLLRPENQAALQRVLMTHVVAAKVPSSALLPTATVKTASGAEFKLGLRVGTANVIQADIQCANGIIHVIDAVLLPPARKTKPLDARMVIDTAIDKGVPMFNAGDEQGCADVYLAAAQRLVEAGQTDLADLARWELAQAIEHAPADASKRAWALRNAFDRALEDMAFEPKMEASLPAGFPKPGPVGRVIAKSYPQYRAARAEDRGQGGSFWALFQHIKKNNVEMTAPVEMTMDDEMRMEDMAFLYGSPEQGAAGTQGRVEVLDLDRVEVLSIGMRGRRADDGLKKAKALVEKRLKELGLRASGPWRVFGYNSPMVAAKKQYWELQLPVTKE
jgi:uncharacterized surface protein with fasciclin (FAS1) repeats